MCLSVGLPIALLAIFYKIIEIIISVKFFCGFFLKKHAVCPVSVVGPVLGLFCLWYFLSLIFLYCGGKM